WRTFVRHMINELNRMCWHTIIVTSQGNLTFKAFAYTKPQGSGAVAPLYQQDKTHNGKKKTKQAKLLFLGTSVVKNKGDTLDI
ncbi:hypothetical protein CROQUDRAFT_23475, partial [Cronartium quercuum f. sp. fusiforme G11]